MVAENAKKNSSALRGSVIETTAHPNVVGTLAPYRMFKHLVRGFIAVVLMGMWGVTLVFGMTLLRPDVSQPSGVLTVLAVPILFVAALPIVYRHWVKNRQSL